MHARMTTRRYTAFRSAIARAIAAATGAGAGPCSVADLGAGHGLLAAAAEAAGAAAVTRYERLV